MNGTVALSPEFQDGSGSNATMYPSICLDSNNILHVFYFVNDGTSHIYHRQKPLVGSAWSNSEVVYSTSEAVKGLTSWVAPLDNAAIAWSEGSSNNITFASTSLPFGSAGANIEPWERDGVSPYGTYFTQNGNYISPGTGAMITSGSGSTIAGRNGVDLSLSMIYQQPRFFSKTTGLPYMTASYPFGNVGQFWGLDLPWMDEYYVYIGNGERFVIQWGNNGVAKEFVNHASVHFVMRDVTKGGVSYYELITSSGTRYEFDHDSPYRLEKISDLIGYDPLASTYSEPLNNLALSYDANGRLVSITDSGLGRSIALGYNANGLVSTITYPDDTAMEFTYTSVTNGYGTFWYLESSTDPLGRVATYYYNETADNLLDRIVYPTHARLQWTYQQDDTVSTEQRAWMITSEATRNDTSGALIRQTSIDYKIVNGKVSVATLRSFDEGGYFQGSTRFVFQSALRFQDEVSSDANSTQMQRSRTWFDDMGQPLRIDQYLGDSTDVNYSTYHGYDDWGNQIYTKDALGHESYVTFANTSTQNSFLGVSRINKTSSGLLLYEGFDDWDYSSWTKNLVSGSSSLDGSMDTPHSPAMKLYRSSSNGYVSFNHTFASQSVDFCVQVSYKTDGADRGLVLLTAAGVTRVNFASYNNNFEYYSGTQWVIAAPCSAQVWYDVGFLIHPGNNTYDIYINGAAVKVGAPLLGSGSINAISFQAGAPGATSTTVWFDDVRVYKSLTITINGSWTNIAFDLYDSRGVQIARSRTTSIVIPAMPMYSPPATLRVSLQGTPYFNTPLMDIWGGDVYTVDDAIYKSAFPMNRYGLGEASAWMPDDNGVPAGYQTYYYSANEAGNRYVPSHAYALTGSGYHTSEFVPASSSTPSHYHGWRHATNGMHITTSTDAIIQYIWLEDGKIPQEIVLQYYVGGVWKRAFWGGGANNQDIVTMEAALNSPTVRFRVGDVPQVTGQWLQLTVRASDLGIASGADIRGVIYGLYGGIARWDYGSTFLSGVQVADITAGMIVKMRLDNGAVISQTSTGTSMWMNIYSVGLRTFPIACSFDICAADGTLLYSTPRLPAVYSGDKYLFSSTTLQFYPNAIKSGLHDRLVGTLEYQDAAETVSQESYSKYDFEGNEVLSKAKLGTSWIYSQATYDQYGNLITSIDGSGKTSVSDYTSGNGYVYPAATRSGGRTEMFESDTSWTSYKTSSNGNTAWLTSNYQSTRVYDGKQGLQISFTNGPSGSVYGTTMRYKDFYANTVSSISVRMYMDTYTHGGTTGETMDSGIRMRLYDSSGSNYGTYTYWLACWYNNQNNRTAPDAFTKVIYGKPAEDAWLNPVLNPNADWTIDWSRCDKVRFELYSYGSTAASDTIVIYYDDFSFDDTPNPLSLSPSQLGMTSYVYDNDNGLLVSSTDPLGHVTSYEYDDLGRVVRVNNSDGVTYVTKQYDDANNEASLFDELGQRTVQHYDELGRLIRTERFGLSATAYSSGTISYTWQDQPRTTTDAVGRVTKFYYDYLGRSTVTRYMNGTMANLNVVDSLESGNAWQSYKYATTTPSWLTSQYSTARSYSPTHSLQVSFANAPAGYDAGGAMMYQEFQASEVSLVSLRMYVDDYIHGGTSGETMDSGLRMRLYDANGVNFATYTYWLACWSGGVNNRTAPDANTKVLYGQPALDTWLSVALAPDADFDIDWSRCDKVRFEVYADVSGASGDQLTAYFDDLSFTGALYGYAQSGVVYDDRNATVTRLDENGNKVVSVMDFKGRLNATREFYAPSSFYQTLMAYDAVGNLKTIKASNGQVTRFAYDSLDRKTSNTYPDGYSESWTYNYAGQPITHTDRSGTVETSAYDTSGRLIRVLGTSDKYATKYNADGMVVEAKNNLGSFTYQYNSRHQVTSMTEVISGTSYSFSYGYDLAGKVTSESYPDSSSIIYEYDNYSRVSKVKAGNNQLLSISYNLDDSVASKSECNGNSTVTYSYNYRGWTSSIVARDASSNAFMDLAYEYDNAGNVMSIVSAIGPAGTETYQYDALNRLTKAIGAWGTIQYGYDSVGNRQWMNDGTNRSYSYGSYNKLSSDGTWSYAYDSDGNVAWKNSTATQFHYIYNSFGQMTSVEKRTYSGGWSAWSTIAAYSYDANGARARTVEGAVTNNFVYRGHDTECQFGVDGKSNKYVYVGSRLELRTCSALESYAYISDALGSSRFVLKNGVKDVPNTVFVAVTYKPFGAAYSTTGSDRITFASETADDPTGLVYLFARYYDPALGRFYALDPVIGEASAPQTLDRYVYCANNPLIHTDPSGRFFGLHILGGALVGAVIGGVLAAASGGDWKDVLAGAAGGAVGGAFTAATFGMGGGVALGMTAVRIGFVSGAVEGGVRGALKSGGDIGETLKGAAVEGVLGAVTGKIGGRTVGKIIEKTNVFDKFGSRAAQELTTLHKNSWADKVAKPMMKEKTAKSWGRQIGISGQIATESLFDDVLKTGFKIVATDIYDSYSVRELRQELGRNWHGARGAFMP